MRVHVLIAVESGFAASLYDLCRNIVHEFVVLCRHCLEGGQAALETMFQERLVSNTAAVMRIVMKVQNWHRYKYENYTLHTHADFSVAVTAPTCAN